MIVIIIVIVKVKVKVKVIVIVIMIVLRKTYHALCPERLLDATGPLRRVRARLHNWIFITGVFVYI